jgi:hypothetical protein
MGDRLDGQDTAGQGRGMTDLGLVGGEEVSGEVEGDLDFPCTVR